MIFFYKWNIINRYDLISFINLSSWFGSTIRMEEWNENALKHIERDSIQIDNIVHFSWLYIVHSWAFSAHLTTSPSGRKIANSQDI